MSLIKYIDRIRRVDAMIRRKSTGPPAEFAKKLGISERWLYKFLKILKEELDCPIEYDRYRKSYVYRKYGNICFGFKTINKKNND